MAPKGFTSQEYMLCEGVLGGIGQPGGPVVGDVGHAQVLEHLEMDRFYRHVLIEKRSISRMAKMPMEPKDWVGTSSTSPWAT